MMNPFSWLQMTNMISYQGLVRTFPKIIRASTYRTRISYLCRDGKVWGMTVQIVFATYLNGASGAILVVSDRFVLLDEILCAHQALTGCRNVRQRKASVSS